MTNQTLPNDANNRYKKDVKALENKLRSIWLGVVAEVRTLIITSLTAPQATF